MNQLHRLSHKEVQLPKSTPQVPSILPLNAEFELLVKLITHRLSFMKDVAAYKWENQIAIVDSQREKVVIENSLQKAEAYQLDGPSIRLFFETQITLAKVIEQYWFDEWEAKGSKSLEYLDLPTVIRPALIRLGDDILKAIKACTLWLNTQQENQNLGPVFCKYLVMKGISVEEKHRLFKALLAIKPLASHTS